MIIKLFEPDNIPDVLILPPAMLAVVVMFEVEFSADTTLLLKLNPAAFKLPPVMLAVAEINPGVVTLPPAMLLVTLSADTTFELKLNPAAFKLPPVTLPVTLTVVPVTLPT